MQIPRFVGEFGYLNKEEKMQTIKNTIGFTIAMALVTWPMITDMLFGTHLTVGYAIILLTVGYLKKRR